MYGNCTFCILRENKVHGKWMHLKANVDHISKTKGNNKIFSKAQPNGMAKLRDD